MGERKGGRRLESTCLDSKGKPVNVMKRAPKSGVKPEFEPLIGVPSDVKEKVPLIYIGTNRSLKEQLPSGRYSLLRQLLSDVNAGLCDPEQVVQLKKSDGSTESIQRLAAFNTLMEKALSLLRTAEFNAIQSVSNVAHCDSWALTLIPTQTNLIYSLRHLILWISISRWT